MKIISIQLNFEGICIVNPKLLQNADRAKVSLEDRTYFCRFFFWGGGHKYQSFL